MAFFVMRVHNFVLVVLLVTIIVSGAANARSTAVCRQSLDPFLFGEYQHCPTDQESSSKQPPPLDCIITPPGTVELTVGIGGAVGVECPGFTCTNTTWKIFKDGIEYGEEVPPAVEITVSGDSSATLLSSEEFKWNGNLNEGFSLRVTSENPENGGLVNCAEGIESSQPGPVDDYYELRLATDKDVYRLGENGDEDINAVFTVLVPGNKNGNGSVDLTYFLKNSDGIYLLRPVVAPVEYTNGEGSLQVLMPIETAPVGIYLVGGELSIKEGERHTSNNRAQKFVTILEQSQEVNIPETNPVLVVIVALSVVFLVGKGKKQLN